jgi:hypothetical protein
LINSCFSYNFDLGYLQTDTLKEKEWSNRLHGLGYCPCPYMNKENGYTYKHLEIYGYAERLLSKECELV